MTAPVNGIASALQQMQAMAAQASGASAAATAAGNGAATASGFAGALKASLDRISDTQMKAAGEAKAFELGAPNVSLNDVMIDS
ncbi:Flagellar hook-basal body complex protein FliE [Burkholderia gladioli]|nr:Flagellar hook-basal body complex protein FliE [Burkholderia gladioli]